MLRGSRSQVAWSRRLGYASNVAYPWESGRRQPNASETLRAIARSGRNVAEGLTVFYGRPPPWLAHTDPTSPQAVTQLLEDLRGDRTTTALARAAGLNRNAVSRWLLGRTWGSEQTNLRIENRFDPAVFNALREAGHDLEVIGDFDEVMGHAGALVRHPSGLIEGAFDPRSDGDACAA